MLSKRRYIICICSVILGRLEPFRNYKGFCSIVFSKILDLLRGENFSDYCLSNFRKFQVPFFLRNIVYPGEGNVKN